MLTEPAVRLTTRQKHVLALVLESGSAGPSIVSRELGVGLSTAYRDLASLEEHGLIVSEGGKRTLTEKGLSYLGTASTTTYDR
jgi:DeoR/GlpR family transcriptional regulator of sugar metabolism